MWIKLKMHIRLGSVFIILIFYTYFFLFWDYDFKIQIGNADQA